jgi:hypothetical protein
LCNFSILFKKQKYVESIYCWSNILKSESSQQTGTCNRVVFRNVQSFLTFQTFCQCPETHFMA